MKIAVDCYELKKHVTGVGRVLENILPSLFSLLPEHDFFLYTCEEAGSPPGPRIYREVIPDRGGYFRWQNGPFYKAVKSLDADVLIASNYTLPIFTKLPSLLFEYDISFISHPEWYPWKEARIRRHLVRRSIKKATAVLTISRFSKQEIQKHVSVSQDKIGIMPLGIESSFRRSSKEEILSWRKRKDLEGKTVVGFLGSIFNRRNIPLLVRAVELLRKDIKNIMLYIVGKDLTHPPRQIAKILNRDWIRWEKRINADELNHFYSSLDVFAYLSEYEGFGLPPLESLSCGTVPVLLKKGALAEIYPKLGVFVEKPDGAQVKAALMSLLQNRKIQEEALREFENRRQDFSWEKAALIAAEKIKDLLHV